MHFLRLVIIAVVIWFAIRVVRRALTARSAGRGRDDDYRGEMVTCSLCGVYLPENDATSTGDGKFRCDRH